MIFDKCKLSALKCAYQDAIKKKWDRFEFEGEQMLTSYAKYLIEFLEGRLK